MGLPAGWARQPWQIVHCPGRVCQVTTTASGTLARPSKNHSKIVHQPSRMVQETNKQKKNKKTSMLRTPTTPYKFFPTVNTNMVICNTLSNLPLLELLLPSSERADKQQKVWVGDGLPASIPKELHSRIIEWQFIDLAELRPPSSWDVLQADPQDAQKLPVTPNLNISRPRKKTIKDILMWTQCFTVHGGPGKSRARLYHRTGCIHAHHYHCWTGL